MVRPRKAKHPADCSANCLPSLELYFSIQEMGGGSKLNSGNKRQKIVEATPETSSISKVMEHTL